MELREIRIFLTLAEELNFSRTAVRLRTAQSAVSYGIKNLESELGVKLFTRASRKVALTPAGEGFRVKAQHALLELNQAAETARSVGAGRSGKLRLRFGLLSGCSLVPRAVARFQAEYPDVELDVAPAGSVEQLEDIRAGRCDVGFMSILLEAEPLASELIERSPLVAILPSKHRLAKAKHIRLEQLASERFVFLKLSDEPRVRGFFRQRCLTAGFEPNVAFEIEQVEMLLALVASGLGVSCLPGLVRMLSFPGVEMIPLSPVVNGGVSAVWDPRTLSPAAQHFLNILRLERARPR